MIAEVNPFSVVLQRKPGSTAVVFPISGLPNPGAEEGHDQPQNAVFR